MSRRRRFVSDNQFYVVVGDRLSILRQARNLRQEDVANTVGVSRTSIVNIESGKQTIDLLLAAKFATLYGISVDAIAPKTSGLPDGS